MMTLGHDKFEESVIDLLRSAFIIDSQDSPGFSNFHSQDLTSSSGIIASYYLFNVTNAEAVLAGTEIPNVVEVLYSVITDFD